MADHIGLPDFEIAKLRGYQQEIAGLGLVALMDQVAPVFIGLWRFHLAGQDPDFCVTYRWKGCYYETAPQPSACAALRYAALRYKLLQLYADEVDEMKPLPQHICDSLLQLAEIFDA